MMNVLAPGLIASIQSAPRYPWRPLFWEPVSGSGERLMVGALYEFDGEFGTARIIRDDVLDSLYGKQSAGAKNVIEHGIAIFREAARASGSLEPLGISLMGLMPGDIRVTAARSLSELLRTIALLHSSLANLDKLEELEEADAPLQEDINRRFSTEVKELTVREHPVLGQYFGRSAKLFDGGQDVRFGFCSPSVIAHFNVLHPIRLSASLRDVRARLFELQHGKALVQASTAALIGAVSRDDDATLSDRQRQSLREAKREIAYEAESAGAVYYPVHTAIEGSQRLIVLAA